MSETRWVTRLGVDRCPECEEPWDGVECEHCGTRVTVGDWPVAFLLVEQGAAGNGARLSPRECEALLASIRAARAAWALYYAAHIGGNTWTFRPDVHLAVQAEFFEAVNAWHQAGNA